MYWMVERELRKTFRTVRWVGGGPRLPPDLPAIVYANHHGFYDGYLLTYLVERIWHRAALIWMAELDRFPFFRPGGALPFPPGDPARRTQSIRETARALGRDPKTVLIYFPEGDLHPHEEGVREAGPSFQRLDRIFPEKIWLPVALRITGWEHAHPTALLTAGSPHRRTSGRETDTLAGLLRGLEEADATSGATLLAGRNDPGERWDFSWMKRLFLPPSRR